MHMCAVLAGKERARAWVAHLRPGCRTGPATEIASEPTPRSCSATRTSCSEVQTPRGVSEAAQARSPAHERCRVQHGLRGRPCSLAQVHRRAELRGLHAT